MLMLTLFSITSLSVSFAFEGLIREPRFLHKSNENNTGKTQAMENRHTHTNGPQKKHTYQYKIGLSMVPFRNIPIDRNWVTNGVLDRNIHINITWVTSVTYMNIHVDITYRYQYDTTKLNYRCIFLTAYINTS